MKTQLVGAWLLAGCLWAPTALQAQVGIGTVSPRPNAILELSGTTRGFLLPRLTTADKEALATALATAASPQDLGMMVYDREKLSLLVWNGKAFVSPGGGFALPFTGTEAIDGTAPLFNVTNTGEAPVGYFEQAATTGVLDAYALQGRNSQANGGIGVMGVSANAAGTNGVGVMGAAYSVNSIGGVFFNDLGGIALRVMRGSTLLDGKLGVGTTTPGAQVDILPPKGIAALGMQANRDGGAAAIISNNAIGGVSSIGLEAMALGGTNDNIAARFTTPFPSNFNTGVSVVSQNAYLGSIGVDLDIAAIGPAATVTGVRAKVAQSGTGRAAAFHAEAIGAGAFSLYAPSGNVYVGKRLGIQTETPAHALDVAGDVKLGTGSTPFSNMLYGRKSLLIAIGPGGSSTTGISVPGVTTAHHVMVTQKSLLSDIVISYATVTTSDFIVINFRNLSAATVGGTVEITFIAIAP